MRLYETDAAYRILFNHELDETGGADNGLDMWNNAIGMKIGKHVRDNKGGWEDIVRLSRAAIVGSFTEGNYDQIKKTGRGAVLTTAFASRLTKTRNFKVVHGSAKVLSMIMPLGSIGRMRLERGRGKSFLRVGSW
ncbi:hypothetical protein QW131_15290 [Roseibium salinum]|nr:hypothetical protein [Roseibium salinum]